MLFFDSNNQAYENVSDYLKEEYLKWNPRGFMKEDKLCIGERLIPTNNIVFIESPTGAGKSFFVCNTLANYAREIKCNILYLVNRKVLKEQIQEQVDNNLQALQVACPSTRRRKNVEVMSYQQIEEMLNTATMNQVVERISCNYQYIVADEAHYFLQDSSYNVNTILSFEVIRQARVFTKIFMSATLEEIKEVIEEKITENRFHIQWPNRFLLEPRIWNYALYRKDNYIRPKVFGSYEELCSIILSGIDKGKWLVFVDSIENGKELKKNLTQSESFKESDVVFIDAKYEENENAYWATRDLIENSCIKSKVVIATIVLDNGINFDDMKLKNIAIVQDTKTELIQSLGRKRIRNGESINLYLWNGVRLKFEQRLRNAEEHVKLINEFLEYETKQELGTAKMLEKIFMHESIYRCTKRFLYYDRESKDLQVSNLAIVSWANAVKNYQRIIGYYNCFGDDGFLRIQEEWLNIDAGSAIEEYYVSSIAELKRKVREEIDGLVDNEMTTDQAIKRKESYRKELLSLFKIYSNEAGKSEEHSPIINNLERPGDNLTKEMFNEIMNALELPYYMEERHGKGNTKYFTIKRSKIVKN